MAFGTTLHLRTLGPIELTGPDPVACTRVAAQPKRLALLAYLAARPAGEWVRRDRILATFWPELPGRRAQGNLRVAVYYLRRQLGWQVIASNRNAVRNASGHLTCDASVLLTGMPGHSADALLGLYRGEFLDGLHVSGAPDFERWVDRTRASLRARATEIAWSLSGRAEAGGEWISAARYARQAANLAVDVEGATQRLIRLLVRAGDGAAAVAEYERLALRLDEDFGIAPSPETSALITPIRADYIKRRVAATVEPDSDRRERPRSLAVLPFKDLTEGSAAYLANGLSEDLLTVLARIRGVRVVSHTSVRQFAVCPPTSIRAVRELLGVDLVLEGSVQLQGDRCRITVQLIDARMDEHLWAETYDRHLSDVFRVQSDVALRISRALEVELSPREHGRLRRAPTTSFQAWRFYLKGREVLGRRTARDAAWAARLFRQALRLDERFASAWVGLADARLVTAAVGGSSLAEATRGAKGDIQRALDCDPESGEARATLGLILTFFDWDHAAAGTEYRRAVELTPGYATARQWYGNWLCVQEQPEQGLTELAAAVDLDPLSPVVSDSMGLALLHLDRLSDAESKFREILELDPNFWRARFNLALCCARRGDLGAATNELVRVWAAGGWGANTRDARESARMLEQDARAALEHLLRSVRSQKGDRTLRMVEIVLLMLLGRHDDAVEALVLGRNDRWLGALVMYAPILDPVAGDPRFRHLMQEVGLLLPRWRSKAL